MTVTTPTTMYHVMECSSGCEDVGMQESRTSPVVKISSSNLEKNMHYLVK
jgi:hypothetical protein